MARSAKKCGIMDRYRGAMLGLAVGDALGAAVETKKPGTFERVKEMLPGGILFPERKAGEWTDDTSMALCLASSLIERQKFDPADQLKRYVRWKNEGYMSSQPGRWFGAGRTTAQSLERFERTGETLAEASQRAGNGSLMRLAPVPLAFVSNPEQSIHYAGESSKTTHSSPLCIDACRYFGGLVVGALQERSKDEILSPRFAPIDDVWRSNELVKEIDIVAKGSFKREPPEIKGTGFVVDSLEAAMWAFHRTNSFEDAIIEAVNLGRDSDTTAAICGQLAGAYYGVEEIPKRWLNVLAQRETIEKLADQLHKLSIK